MSSAPDFGSKIALGLGRLGGDDVSDAEAYRVMAAAVDLGVRLFDAAPSYGHAERRLGDFVRQIGRDRVAVSTKCGYGVPGVPDWTYDCILRGVDAALGRMGIDHIDLMHLHSCPRSTLEHSGVLDALWQAKAAGKIGAVAYSGEGDALALAVEVCDVVQCSVSLADQACIATTLPRALARGAPVLAKRPLASGAWRTGEPGDEATRVYQQRLAAMNLDFGPRWLEVALRFTAFTPGVSACLVGTKSVAHLEALSTAVAMGDLPESERRSIRDAFLAKGAAWQGQI